MTAEEKLEVMRSGKWHYGMDPDIGEALRPARVLCHEFNRMNPELEDERHAIIKRLFARIEEPFILQSPFYCDFGTQISVGRNFEGNFGITILDEGPVTIGDNVFIGPNVSIYTIIHALTPKQRNEGLMHSKPVTIGNNVWIGGNAVILPGVTIGDNAVIGAGSVVTRDVPPSVLAVGNPCRVVRDITSADVIGEDEIVEFS